MSTLKNKIYKQIYIKTGKCILKDCRAIGAKSDFGMEVREYQNRSFLVLPYLVASKRRFEQKQAVPELMPKL
jgi:hypothetical protein